MQTIEIQSFSYQERTQVLASLSTALTQCGCWITDRRSVLPTQVEICFEAQLSSAVELYTAILGAGVELTRGAHLALTYLCMCRKHMRRRAEFGQVVELRLEISFLEDVTLHALLSSARAPS
ncbi:MAG: hypothetical protein KGK08_13090 [Acidobacteriota bacterium]|nr:hypothetical protein [Acidobacteriota bacterium]